MAQKNTPPKNVKVEVRPASNILKILLIVLILFSIVALIALRWVHNGIRQETQNLCSFIFGWISCIFFELLICLIVNGKIAKRIIIVTTIIPNA